LVSPSKQTLKCVKDFHQLTIQPTVNILLPCSVLLYIIHLIQMLTNTIGSFILMQ